MLALCLPLVLLFPVTPESNPERAQRELERTAAQLREAAQANPTSARAWYALGRSWAALAGEDYRQLLGTTPPGSPYALAVKADGLMHHSEYRRAFLLFRETLSKDPNLASARSAIIQIYRSEGHEDWASKERTILVKLDCTAYKLACDSMTGHYDEILAATSGQQTPAALYWRAEAYTGLSYQAFTKLMQLPPSPEMYRFKAGLQYEAGHRARVVEELRRAVALAPGDRELERELAMALGSAWDYPAAYELAVQLLRDSPESAELNALAGDALLNQQKARTAIPFLKKALGSDPNNLMTHRSLGLAYMQTGHPKLALPHLQRAIPMDRDGSVQYQLALAYRQTGQPELAAKAMTAYRQLSTKAAIEPDPEITAPE